MPEEKLSEVLYHYCSTDAFHAIVESRTIWLSSLSSSNDALEGRLIAQIMNELLLSNPVSAEHTKYISV